MKSAYKSDWTEVKLQDNAESKVYSHLKRKVCSGFGAWGAIIW